MGSGVSRSTAAAATADVAASAVLTSDDAYLDVEEVVTKAVSYTHLTLPTILLV